MKRRLAWILTLLLALGCVMGALAQESGEIIPKEDQIVVPVGKRVQVKYSASPNAIKKGGVTYESSDEAIATVDYKGRVKGVAEGECTLTITSRKDPAVSATVPVRVVVAVEKVTVTAPQTTLAVGDTVQLGYVCQPEEATLKEVTFSSSKETVATVDANGLVTAVGRGEANITVQSVDGSARAKVKITVQQMPEEIRFKKSEYTVPDGKKLKFKVTVLPSNANNKKVVWTSSDESIATVDRNGNLKVYSTGDVTITAASEANPAVSASVVVHSVKPIKSLRFDATRYEMTIGQTLQLSPLVTPEDATVTGMAYSAKNQRICSVDENGVVTALSGGRTTVTVYSKENANRKATVAIYVQVPVTGVQVDQKGFRLDVDDHLFGKVKVLPLDATDKGLVWVSSDESIAAVTNISYRPRIEGYKWGRCTLTGTTVDGGYTASINVNVGMLHKAVLADSARRDGEQLLLNLTNNSDMHITSLTLAVQKEDDYSTMEKITIPVDLAPFAAVEALAVPVQPFGGMHVAVYSWETDTGYYTNQEALRYSYRIANGLLEWVKAR